MLNEFLVLGQIPGTNFQITFSELALLFDIALVVFLLRKNHVIFQKFGYYRLYIHLYFSTKRGQQLSLPV
jgi:hypothetical protein